MPTSRALANPARLAALHKTGLLDTPVDERFDAFTRLAAQILGVPTVLMSLVDTDRQYNKSAACSNGKTATGWNALESCLCQDVVANGTPLVLSDAQADPELSERGTELRGYAGVPLITDDGSIVGALGALDSAPREWTEKDLSILKAVAAGIVSEIQRRVSDRAAHDMQLRLIAERTLAHSVQQQM
ncbi:MAG TPA: GAF domain-containing protein, partial [Gemmatimonadaceae bacterium]|nr:GAF domain-containing protein [Gemmatimonadaceae bacterium]